MIHLFKKLKFAHLKKKHIGRQVETDLRQVYTILQLNKIFCQTCTICPGKPRTTTDNNIIYFYTSRYFSILKIIFSSNHHL